MMLETRIRLTKEEYGILMAIANKYGLSVNTVIKSCIYSLIDTVQGKYNED